MLRTPDAVALIADEARLTYAQLNEHANRIADRLVGLGAGLESLVGLFLHRNHFMLPAMLGILKAGAGLLSRRSGLSTARIAFMLEDARIRTVVTEPAGPSISSSCRSRPSSKTRFRACLSARQIARGVNADRCRY